jgi:hypothetical protein
VRARSKAEEKNLQVLVWMIMRVIQKLFCKEMLLFDDQSPSRRSYTYTMGMGFLRAGPSGLALFPFGEFLLNARNILGLFTFKKRRKIKMDLKVGR